MIVNWLDFRMKSEELLGFSVHLGTIYFYNNISLYRIQSNDPGGHHTHKRITTYSKSTAKQYNALAASGCLHLNMNVPYC